MDGTSTMAARSIVQQLLKLEQDAKHPKLELLRYLLRMAIKEANEKSDIPEVLPDHIQNDANRANSCL